MVIKKRNHTVSKTLLKRWKTHDEKIWVLDIEKQVIENRSLKSTFAITKYIYVPQINDKRNDLTERWFERPEDELAKFLDFIALDSSHSFKNFNHQKHNFSLLKLGIAGMAYRSSYEIESVISCLNSNESMRKQFEIDLNTDEEKHRFAVENMVNNIVLSDRRFMNSELTTVNGYHKDLIVCDRPAIDLFQSLQLLGLPVGPRTLMFLDANKNIGFNFMSAIEKVESDKMVDLMNELTIQRARKWIVGTSKKALEKILEKVSLVKIKQRSENDQQVYVPISEETRKTLYSLPDT